MMMMDDESQKSVLNRSKSCPGAYGGPPGGNEGPSKNSVAPKSSQSISEKISKIAISKIVPNRFRMTPLT